MEWKLIRTDPVKAREYFERKMTFTLGPMEIQYYKQHGQKVQVIDVRAPEDFEKGHVPGAINVPEDRWESFQGLSKDQTSIFYCYSIVCHLAAKACVFFASKGFPVAEMEGGWEYWQHSKLTEEKGKAQAA